MELDSIFSEMDGTAADGVTWPLVARYCSGDATAAEVEIVRRWVGTDLTRQQELEFLRKVWAESSDVLTRPRETGDVERGWAILAGRMQASGVTAREEPSRPALRRTDTLGAQPPRRGERFTGQPRFVWAAASVLLLCLVSVLGWAINSHNFRSRGGKGDMLAYVTGNGERSTVMLPDGDTVFLNVASKLEVPLDYMQGNHTVRLIGEALFTVPNHRGAPLTVRTGATTTRVLGTSFLVCQYPADTTALVAVREGKVAVGEAVVAARQAIVVQRTGASSVKPFDETLFTFANGILTINGTSLATAIPTLDRWFDADIRIGDAGLAARPLVAEFAAGSLSDLSKYLELIYNVRVVRSGRVLTLYRR